TQRAFAVAVVGERLHCRFVRTENTIISCVDIGAAEFQRVHSLHPRDITISLRDVLWSTEGNGIPRAERQISREGDRITSDEGFCQREEVQAGNNALWPQRLLIVQPV